jgi:histidinol-phosphate aminotransferase
MEARNIHIRSSYGPKWTQWSRVSCGKMEDVARYAEALPALVVPLAIRAAQRVQKR